MRSVRHPSSSLLRCPWERRSAPGGGHLLQTPNPFFFPLSIEQQLGRPRHPSSTAAVAASSSPSAAAVAASSSPSAGRQSRPRPTSSAMAAAAGSSGQIRLFPSWIRPVGGRISAMAARRRPSDRAASVARRLSPALLFTAVPAGSSSARLVCCGRRRRPRSSASSRPHPPAPPHSACLQGVLCFALHL